MLVVCVTNAEQIEMVERGVGLSEDVPPSDWANSTLKNMVLTTDKAGGLTYEDLRDAYGKRTAVTLCATQPDSMKILQTLFDLPS